MKIDPFKVRTTGDPINGVKFDRVDESAINNLSQMIMELPEGALLAMRNGLAKEIVYLSELADWTSGEAEENRLTRLKWAIMSYQATYATHAYVRSLKVGNQVMGEIFGEDES